MRIPALIAILLTALALWAQQAAKPAAQNQNATEPQIGYAAQSQTHNTLIGCVSGSANQLSLVQAQEHRTYRLLGNTAAVTNDIGKLVKLTGRFLPQSGAVFEIQAAEDLGEPCHYLASPGHPPTPVTGKTGSQGDAENTSSTASQGQVTPGFDTQAGRAQAPGHRTGLNAGGVRPPQNQTAVQGAPLTPEQAAQNPAAAETIAQAAQRPELDNSQHQLGVNAEPAYAQNSQGQSRTQIPKPAPEKEVTAKEQQQPTLVGCLTQGSQGSQFFLTEQKSGTRHELKGRPEELKNHINHFVEVVGRPVKSNEMPHAVSGSKQSAFEVGGVQDLAPTCGAGQHK